MKKFILSIDQGTTGTTALLIDASSFELIDQVNQEFKQFYPTPSWVEHDLSEIWESVGNTIKKVLEKNKINGEQIAAIGITNQRETTCAYNKAGEPISKAIVWQDRRTTEYCEKNEKAYKPLHKKTGLPLDPYFSGTKMNWLLNNNDQVKSAAENNDLCLSTIDSFLLYKLSAQTSFATEPSNASRTLLMDLDSCQWDQELLDFFKVNKSFLPQIQDSFTEFGRTKGLSFLPDDIPISCILGDQQAALFGQAGHACGSLKCTYGTGAFILLNTGDKKTYSTHGLLTTVAYKKNGKACYALEGASYIAGAAVQWLRDNLQIIDSSPEVEALAREVTDLSEMEHLLFLPFFTGIGSPYWNANAKAAIVGLTRDTGKPHLARACLDGIALSINDSIQALIADSPESVPEIRVDGGASMNNLLLEIQAGVSQKKIVRPKVIETTAYGVALGAALGIGEISLEQIDSLWQSDKVQEIVRDEYYQKKSQQWTGTIKKLF